MAVKDRLIIKNILELGFDDCKEYIQQSFCNSFLDLFLAIKGPEKIYKRKDLSESQKDVLIKTLVCKCQNGGETIQQVYNFIEIFAPIILRFESEIKDLIKSNFNNSQYVFNFCLGTYINKHPLVINLARQILISLSKDCLINDFDLNCALPHCILPEIIYNKKEDIIKLLYDKAVKYGCILEKYDAISFQREKIFEYHNDYRPVIKFRLVDCNFEFGLLCAETYMNNRIAIKNNLPNNNPIFLFYKCKICRFCSLNDMDKEIKEWLIDMLQRQFDIQNVVDNFYFYTSTFATIILSILLLIYIKLLLLEVSDDKFLYIKRKEIRQQIFAENRISEKEFNLCYELITNNKIFQSYFSVFKEGILICDWSFDLDLNIIELTKEISFNARMSEVGNEVDKFGKNFETIVRGRLNDLNWKTVKNGIKIKKQGKIVTDIDLLSYHNGVVLIGQIKTAHCGRSCYQIWKAKQTIDKAIKQINISMTMIEEDPNIIYSNLKREHIIGSKSEIKSIIPIIITSSDYFLGYNKDNITVLGFEMLDHILCMFQPNAQNDNIIESITNPFEFFSLNRTESKVISEIDKPEFQFFYEEYEAV